MGNETDAPDAGASHGPSTARPHPPDQCRARAHRAYPLDTLPKDRARHFSPASQIVRTLCGMARVRCQRVDAESNVLQCRGLGGVDKIGRLDRLADHALIYA